MFSIFWTNGQICSATSRLLIHERIADRFLAFLQREVEKIKVGHPLEAGVRMGPLVNKIQVSVCVSLEGSSGREGAGRPYDLLVVGKAAVSITTHWDVFQALQVPTWGVPRSA